jgi:hypothetical protein
MEAEQQVPRQFFVVLLGGEQAIDLRLVGVEHELVAQAADSAVVQLREQLLQELHILADVVGLAEEDDLAILEEAHEILLRIAAVRLEPLEQLGLIDLLGSRGGRRRRCRLLGPRGAGCEDESREQPSRAHSPHRCAPLPKGIRRRPDSKLTVRGLPKATQAKRPARVANRAAGSRVDPQGAVRRLGQCLCCELRFSPSGSLPRSPISSS